ncbi:hypothetical protein ACFMQL_25995 [Nonomuraea fastidiosa]|uniref:hypothetical protein n=1 Tax=Nonomuraea TaxID=83681 RepID=UPI0032483560
MKSLSGRAVLRTSAVAAVALAGGLLVAPPANAAAPVTSAPAVTTVTLTAQQAAAARPRNGRILYDRISGGLGQLKIKNGTSRDGVVALVKGRKKAISIYVRAKSSATIRDVRDGTYTIYFTTGTRYSVSKGRFTRGASYQRFNNRLRFTTTSRTRTIWTITLNPVKGGTARTSHVNPKDFPA